MHKSAFSLVELLIVITILSILVALLLPSINIVRDAAQRISCGNRMTQISLGILLYARNNESLIPDTGTGGVSYWQSRAFPSDIPGQEEDARYVSLPNIFKCPDDRTGGKYSYAINLNLYNINYTTNAAHASKAAWFTSANRFLIVEARDAGRSNFSTGYFSTVNNSYQVQCSGHMAHKGKGANYTFIDGHLEYIAAPCPDILFPPSVTYSTYAAWDTAFAPN